MKTIALKGSRADLGVQQRSRVLEATAIAAYHSQTQWPVVQVLVCDDAPQFKLLTTDIAFDRFNGGFDKLPGVKESKGMNASPPGSR